MVPIAEAPPIAGLLHLCIYCLVLIEDFVTKTYLVLSTLQEKARNDKIQGLPARTTLGTFKTLQSTGFLLLTPTGAIYVTLCPYRCKKQPFLAFFQLTIFHRAKLQLPSLNTQIKQLMQNMRNKKIFVNQVFRKQQGSG